MALASTSRVQMLYKPEAVFGVIDSSGNPYNLRITGEGLNFDLSKEMSQEINADRSVSSAIPVSAQSAGNIQGELQYAEYDRLIAATMQGSWSPFSVDGISDAFTGSFGATTITASVATSGSSAWSTLAKGQFITVGPNSGLNSGKTFRISPSVAPTDTVITLDAGTPAIVEASVANSTIRASRLTHGTTQTSFSFERQALDVGQYLAYTGQTPSKMSIQIASGSLSTISFDFMGKGATRGSSSRLPGSPVASYDYDIHSGVFGSSLQIWEGGSPLSGVYVKSLTLDFDNSLRMQEAIGTLGAVAIASGTINASVSMQMYFSNGAMFDKFLANTNTELVFSSFDGNGNGYVFTCPRANIATHNVVAGSKDQDLMVDVTFNLLRDASNATPALRKVLIIDRMGAAIT